MANDEHVHNLRLFKVLPDTRLYDGEGVPLGYVVGTMSRKFKADADPIYRNRQVLLNWGQVKTMVLQPARGEAAVCKQFQCAFVHRALVTHDKPDAQEVTKPDGTAESGGWVKIYRIIDAENGNRDVLSALRCSLKCAGQFEDRINRSQYLDGLAYPHGFINPSGGLQAAILSRFGIAPDLSIGEGPGLGLVRHYITQRFFPGNSYTVNLVHKVGRVRIRPGDARDAAPMNIDTFQVNQPGTQFYACKANRKTKSGRRWWRRLKSALKGEIGKNNLWLKEFELRSYLKKNYIIALLPVRSNPKAWLPFVYGFVPYFSEIDGRHASKRYGWILLWNLAPPVVKRIWLQYGHREVDFKPPENIDPKPGRKVRCRDLTDLRNHI